MSWRSVRLAGVRRGGGIVRFGPGSSGACRRFSVRAVRCVRGRPPARPSRCRSQTRAIPRLRKARLVPALFRRLAGLLRAHLRRALFPDQRIRQSEPGCVVQQFLPGQRNQGGLRQQYRQCRDRERKALFRTAECVSLSQRDRRGMHLQRQGPDRPRAGQIENDPTLRKGDIVVGADGLMVAGRGADRRGASLNFSPVSEQVRLRHQHVPVVASE